MNQCARWMYRCSYYRWSSATRLIFSSGCTILCSDAWFRTSKWHKFCSTAWKNLCHCLQNKELNSIHCIEKSFHKNMRHLLIYIEMKMIITKDRRNKNGYFQYLGNASIILVIRIRDQYYCETCLCKSRIHFFLDFNTIIIQWVG